VSGGSVEILRVPDDQLWYDEELRYYYQGQPFTGIGYDDSPGVGLSEIRYRDGLQDGWSRDWYPDGVLKAETHYYRNVVHGTHREFREDGTLGVEEQYEYGVLASRSIYSASGTEESRFARPENDPAYEQMRRLRATGWPD
jgi:antitoxin component YwqK of YwqJK toxin-antitoxin module